MSSGLNLRQQDLDPGLRWYLSWSLYTTEEKLLCMDFKLLVRDPGLGLLPFGPSFN